MKHEFVVPTASPSFLRSAMPVCSALPARRVLRPRAPGRLLAVCLSMLTGTALLAGCHYRNDPYVNGAARAHECRYNGFGGMASDNAREANRVCDQALRSAGYLRPTEVGHTGIEELSRTQGGVRIDRVAEGWPAHKAGLAAGDVLVAVNGLMVTQPDQAWHRLFGAAGQGLDIDYLQGGSKATRLRLLRVSAPSAESESAAAR